MKSHVGAKLRASLIGVMLLSGANTALAWDGYATGTVLQVDVTGGNNYGFRVYLSNVANLCGTGSNWGYLNETDSNYKTYVAAILAAKAQGAPITIYTNVANGYCRIEYMAM